jgi:outer membrane protein
MKLRFFLLFFFCIVFLALSAQDQEIALEQVIALALEKNYDVRLAKNSAEAAHTDNDYAFGAFLPTLNAQGATAWNTNDQQLRFEDQNRNNKGEASAHNITGSVQLVWTLFDGTRMFATRERVSVLAEQSNVVIKEQMVNTLANVIANYYDIVRQKQQLRAILEQMSVSEERLKLAERRLQVGTGAKPELLQARVDYNAQRTQALQQEALIRQQKQQLNALVDMQLPQQYDVADTILINLALREQDIAPNIEYANFTLQAARRNVEAANLLVRESRAELFPTINFNAAYNYSRQENIRLINPFAPVFNLTNGYNYGFSINIPILNGFNQRRLIQQDRINLSRQQVLYDQLRTTVNMELRNALINYENAKNILLVEEENIGFAKENVSIALEIFKRGASTFVELRTAQQSLLEAYTRLINARYQAKLAEVELLRLSGRLIR